MTHSDHNHHHSHGASCCSAKGAASAAEAVIRDPVCGMTVDPAAGKPTAEPQPMPKGTQYTCPMHPEIIRDKPGSCPICGMALEPMGVPTGDEGPNPELVDFTRRFWVSAALSAPLLI
ncbi:MAG: copper-transporting ATPase, partial [Mesorhizobium sp.]